MKGPVSAEVVAIEHNAMMKEAERLRKIADNVAIKVPLTPDGLKTCRALAADGTRVNVTLCFSANQALLAAKAGASFISPFVGRLDDIGQTGMELIADIRLIYDNYDFATEILVASVRSPIHILESAKIGADVVTAPPSDHLAVVQASADRRRAGQLPQGLGGDGPEDRLIRNWHASWLTFRQPAAVTLLNLFGDVNPRSTCTWNAGRGRSPTDLEPRSMTMSKFIKLIKNTKGATAIEYGLIAALIAVAAIGAMRGIGTQLGTPSTTFRPSSAAALSRNGVKLGGGVERRRRLCFVCRGCGATEGGF